MANFQKCLNIVIAEDDEDDYLLIAEALKRKVILVSSIGPKMARNF